MSSSVPYSKHDPLRTPTWRYDILRKLLDRNVKKVRRTSYDEYIFQAIKFLRKWRELNKEDRITLFPLNEGLYYAHSLYEDTERDIKTAIEARLLCGQSDEQIAKRIDTLPSAIGWYEALYYNVRDRLQSRDWVFRIIDGPEGSRNIDEQDFSGCIKRAAYINGPAVLEELLAGADLAETNITEKELSGFWDRTIHRNMSRRIALASYRTEINKYNFGQYWTQQTADKVAAHTIKQTDTTSKDFSTIVGQIIENIDFVQGMEAEKHLQIEMTSAEPHIELRADDEMQKRVDNLAAAKQLKPDSK